MNMSKLWMRRYFATCVAICMMASLSGCPIAGTRIYVVSVRNISNQPLGPIAAATHPGTTSFWRLGEGATPGVQRVGELGDPSLLITEMNDNTSVTNVVGTGIPFPSAGRIVPRFGPFADGGSDLVDTQVFTILAAPGDVLSLASMIIGTNDGFWGVDSVELPETNSIVYYASGYDAGTEDNDELDENIDDGASILGPAVIPGDEPDDAVAGDNGGVATDPMGVITNHPGIVGNGDIPADFDWNELIAVVTITATP
ncbi:MAG: spondin domain-containing protein [Candidatus Hydrogenedentes bacterium]|nr:spondin domain-containing protein [Candidatus Hydrogenedentota bacterium]